ncbi:polysaccharide biosynthesis C-terminal domain-containing protein [Aquimarina sp. ERC-38]|uniref:murein biosynthesis integral membrane protein MurJ n=1 Tax=Aquimarina sp. ERC-38 TaxID=2949996 RepID=UPI0022466C39|nr:lipid II flippase MurJ [Aquimarina sp. ERC-38]UZO80244.1 polysaccharide biosynthesis C-terminal domain-containing protein [Aquimarina sp. ERC-38]
MVFKKIQEFIKKPFFQSVLIVISVSLFTKAISFYKELEVAKNFGLSELLDTFLIAMLIPGFINNVFLGSYKGVFIPNYVLELKQKGNIKSFQTTSFIITIAIALFFIIITYFFNGIYLENIFKGHDAEYYNLIRQQLYYLLPCILLWALSSQLTGLLNIDNDFLYSSLAYILLPLGTLFSIWFLKDQFPVTVLAIGILIGSFGVFIYLFLLSIYKKILFIGKLDFRSKNIRILIKQVPVKVSSSVLNSSNSVIDQYFSAQLVVGSVAALNYGLKIPMLVIGLIGMSMGKVVLPYFSKYADNPGLLYDKLKKILSFNFILCVVVAAFLYIFSEWITSLVFERKEFTADDTDIVYRVQQMYIIQIPFYVSGLIMNRYLTSINKNNILLLTSLISLILNTVLNYLLISRFKVYGLALATSIVSLVNTIYLFIYIQRINSKSYV